MIGAGVGLLVANFWCRTTGVPLTGAIITIVVGGLSFYLACDVGVLNDWQWWAGALVVWAAIEAVRPLLTRDSTRRLSH